MSQAQRAAKRAARGTAAASAPAARQEIKLLNPMEAVYADHVVANAPKCERVVVPGSAKGRHVVICGAGPTLATEAPFWTQQGDAVWGCNSALTYLYDRGLRVTHGFTIDQTEAMLEEWATAPDVPEYLVASTVLPAVIDHLLAKGRRLRFFHNYVGIKHDPAVFCMCPRCKDAPMLPPNMLRCPACGGEVKRGSMAWEDFLYATMYPSTVRCGSGLNATTRAIDVALVMGYDRITVVGSDCALRARCRLPDGIESGSEAYMEWLRNDVVMHADGGHALVSGQTAVTLSGEIDGRYWLTKPDMIISAIWLVKMRQLYPQIELIGDTLPNALADKDDEYLKGLPNLTDAQGNILWPEAA